MSVLFAELKEGRRMDSVSRSFLQSPFTRLFFLVLKHLLEAVQRFSQQAIEDAGKDSIRFGDFSYGSGIRPVPVREFCHGLPFSFCGADGTIRGRI